MFVAGFIGSPSMNFINGTFNGKDFIVEGDNAIAIKLNKDHIALLKDYVDVPLCMGVRPEDIYVSGDATNENPGQDLTITCDIAELLGYEKIVYGDLDKQRLTIKVPAKYNIQPEDVNNYSFDMNRICFFNRDTTLRIK
jgi:multiple sugar transport system ATP-binding protein